MVNLQGTQPSRSAVTSVYTTSYPSDSLTSKAISNLMLFFYFRENLCFFPNLKLKTLSSNGIIAFCFFVCLGTARAQPCETLQCVLQPVGLAVSSFG